MLPVDQLHVGLDFRLDDDPVAVAALATSIAELGVLQPLMVRQIDAGWEVVAGRRRLAAARMIGLGAVPCSPRSLTDDEAADIALAENLHRRDLSPVEEALAYARLRDRGLAQQDIAQQVGRSDSHISTMLTLLTIPQVLLDKVHRREMTPHTALVRAGRRQAKPGGVSTHGALTGDTAELITHWRRRHDRLLAGIHQVLKAKTDTVAMRNMLTRLLHVDREPLPEPTAPAKAEGR